MTKILIRAQAITIERPVKNIILMVVLRWTVILTPSQSNTCPAKILIQMKMHNHLTLSWMRPSQRRSLRMLRRESASLNLIKRNLRLRCARTGRWKVSVNGSTNALLPMELTSSARRSTCQETSNLRSVTSSTRQTLDSVLMEIVASSCTLNLTSCQENFATLPSFQKTLVYQSSASNWLISLTN